MKFERVSFDLHAQLPWAAGGTAHGFSTGSHATTIHGASATERLVGGFTGHFTDQAMWYFIGGVAAVVDGLGPSVWAAAAPRLDSANLSISDDWPLITSFP